MALENRMLKQELVNLTQTYEQQMYPLVPIQWINVELLQQDPRGVHNPLPKSNKYLLIYQDMPKEGQINDLVNAYENLLKDF